MRRIVSLWLPRFATESWRRRSDKTAKHGSDRSPSSPLVLVRRCGSKLDLAAVDGAAAAAGLVPGLPLADARAILPDLKSELWQPEVDAEALSRLAAWCGRYTPWSAPDPTSGGLGGDAGVLLDITGCAQLFGGEAALLEDLLTRLAGFDLSARAALASTPGTAWALARFGPSTAVPKIVAPGDEKTVLAPLPPRALRLSPGLCELLERLGLRCIEQLYDLAPAALQPRFGAELSRALRRALGEVPEAISPLRPVAPYLVRRVFAEPLGTLEDLTRALDLLATALARRLETEQRGARCLELTAYRVDGTLQRQALRTSRPRRDPVHMARLFAEHLAAIDPGYGVEVMTLAATASEPLTAAQLALQGATSFESTVEDDLAGLIDRLAARLGPGRVFRQGARESHLPERALAPVAALAQTRSKTETADWYRGRPRPLRLLPRPQPIEAMALLPDHPPARFSWRRQLHRVRRAEGPERLTAEWWDDDPASAQAAPRDYFRVEDEEGRRYWLFRVDGQWFLHGLFA